ALACYRSPEYQRARPLRLAHSVCDFVIFEGHEGVQPDPSAAAPAPAPRKGYWIAHVDVTEPEGYKAYMTADLVPFGRFGGWFLVRGGRQEVVEGKVRTRTVVLEFPSYPCCARLLSIGGLSSRRRTAQRQSRLRFVHHRGL